MAKYASGNLICMVFDSYGTKVATYPLDTGELVKAYEQIGPELVKSTPEGATFAILRVLHNSVERHGIYG